MTLAVTCACGGVGRPPIGSAESAGPGVTVAWRAQQATGSQVDVSLIVEGKEVSLGTLDATSEDTDPASGTPGACSIARADATATQLTCGATAQIQAYLVELRDGELVISQLTGVEQDRASHARREIKRVPVDATTLTVAPYAALSGR